MKMKMKNWKKLMVFILAIAMVTCSMPFAAWAAAPTIKPEEVLQSKPAGIQGKIFWEYQISWENQTWAQNHHNSKRIF